MQSTKKITRAMELIAGSRIVRAQARVQAAVPYSDAITEVVRDLAATGAGTSSPLLMPRPEIRTVAHVVITADRGLCGGYNSSVLRAAEGSMRANAELGRDYRLILVGRKAESYFRYRDYRIADSFTGFDDPPSYENARSVAAVIEQPFLSGECDLVEVIYTRFVSSSSQEVVDRPLMPLDQETLEGGDARPDPGLDGSVAPSYDFEPSADAILERLLPRYVEARIYAALLNACASEHAERQRAMKAATDNADDLMTRLSRIMNRARQDSITTEIMEIAGGAEALRDDGDHSRNEPDDFLAFSSNQSV